MWELLINKYKLLILLDYKVHP